MTRLRVLNIDSSKGRGFSLLELLVVLILISTIFGLVIPQFGKSLSTYTGKSSVKKVAAMLRYARSQAVSKQIIHKVVIDYLGQRLAFSVERKERPEDLSQPGAGLKVFEKVGDKTVNLVYELPEKIKLMAPDSGATSETVDLASIIFYPNGTSNGAELIFADDRAGRYLIKVDFLTGSVRIE